MNTHPDPEHLQLLQTKLDSLGAAQPHLVKDFIVSPIYNRHFFQGIYAISDPRGKLVYIGKTNDGTIESGLADRICGHAVTNSELQINLQINQRNFLEYTVRVIQIDDSILRGLTELYAIAVLKPQANRVGRLQALPDYNDRNEIRNRHTLNSE